MSVVVSAPESLPEAPLAHAGGVAPAPKRLPDEIKGGLAALGGLAVAVITVLGAFGVVKWTSTQTGLATAEVAAAIAFLGACIAHFWPGTQPEPVAVGGTLTALVAATLALVSAFKVWTLTQDEISALVGLITALLAVGTVVLVRSQVTPN